MVSPAPISSSIPFRASGAFSGIAPASAPRRASAGPRTAATALGEAVGSGQENLTPSKPTALEPHRARQTPGLARLGGRRSARLQPHQLVDPRHRDPRLLP